jgi:hypothetical protein
METQSINEIYKTLNSNSVLAEEAYAMTMLQPLLKGRFLPFTGASLCLFCLLHLVNRWEKEFSNTVFLKLTEKKY